MPTPPTDPTPETPHLLVPVTDVQCSEYFFDIAPTHAEVDRAVFLIEQAREGKLAEPHTWNEEWIEGATFRRNPKKVRHPLVQVAPVHPDDVPGLVVPTRPLIRHYGARFTSDGLYWRGTSPDLSVPNSRLWSEPVQPAWLIGLALFTAPSEEIPAWVARWARYFDLGAVQAIRDGLRYLGAERRTEPVRALAPLLTRDDLAPFLESPRTEVRQTAITLLNRVGRDTPPERARTR